MYSKILAAIADDESATLLLDSLAELGGEAKLDLVHVRQVDHLDQRATTFIVGAAQHLIDAGLDAAAQVRVAKGQRVSEEIATVAAELGSDLLVLGSHGHTGLGAMVLGSVGMDTIAGTTLPVLVLRGSDPAERLQSLRKGGRVLIAFDEALHGTGLAECVARLAPGAEVLVVHVRQPEAGPGGQWVETRGHSSGGIGRLVAALVEAGLEARESQPAGMHGVAPAIVAKAASFDADVIVVGSRRPGAMGRLLLGSVAHEVIQLSDRPVLVAGRRAALAHAPRRALAGARS